MDMAYEVFHPDVTEVINFYCDALGFVLKTDRRSDSPQYAVVKHGDAAVGCSERCRESLDQRRPPEGSEIVLQVEDIQAAYAKAQASDWPVADELQEQPWGKTDFRIFDPTGQYLRITD